MRWRSELALVALVALPGCALDEGAPWGVVKAALDVRFEPPPSRIEGGRLITARDYRVAIERIDVAVESVSIASAGEGGAPFDPANPPPGFTLCHNGHCHTDDGRLVPYEEISGGSAGEALVELGGSSVAIEGGAGSVDVPLDDCDGIRAEGCDVLEPGRIASVAVKAALRVRGTAFDSLAESRVPPEGVSFDVVVPEVEVSAAANARFGPTERLGLALDLSLVLPPSLFDAVDFAASPIDFAGLVHDRMREHGELDVAVSRFD